LHGSRYDTTLEVYCDGWSFRLVDPYNNPTLYVRSPKDPDGGEVIYTYPDDDPYFGEFSTFIEAVESTDTTMILSSFEDAVKTYDLTWRIREASEASTRETHGMPATELGNNAPSALETTLTPTAGPTSTTEAEVTGRSRATSTSSKTGLMESVKEGIEKLGLGSKEAAAPALKD